MPTAVSSPDKRFSNFCWLSGSKISPNSVATPAIRKEGEALIDEQNKQTKQTETRSKETKICQKK
jgi:hypothetical protein